GAPEQGTLEVGEVHAPVLRIDLTAGCSYPSGRSTRAVGPHEQSDHLAGMPLGLGGGLGLGQADQQAEVVTALEQGAEVLGGGARLGDAQFAALVRLTQDALQLAEDAA